MSGKNNAENFEDDFELDSLDEASWGEEPGADAPTSDNDLTAEGISSNVKKKKKGGGLFMTVILLTLLGGGSFYAYQSKMIPGLAPGNADLGSSMPVAQTEPVEKSQTLAPEGEDQLAMPPMPEASSEDVVATQDSSAPLSSEDNSLVGQDISQAPQQTDTSVLTPMPGSQAEGISDLAPLDAPEGEIALSKAERDGMQESSSALIPSDSSPEPPVTEAVDGKLTDGVLAIPGDESQADFMGAEDSGPESSEPLDEATLLGETDKKVEDSAISSSGNTSGTPAATALAGEIKSATQPSADSLVENPLATDAKESTPTITGQKPEEQEELTLSQPSKTPENKGNAAVLDLEKELSLDGAEKEIPASVADTKEVVEPAAPDKTQDQANTAETEVSPVNDSAKKQDEEASVKKEIKTSAQESPSKAAEQSKESVKQAPPKVEKPAPSWTLKSAKPGMAVLYDKRTGDVKTVGVGDRVAGIGTVKSVSQINGRWVVQGSSGQVRQ